MVVGVGSRDNTKIVEGVGSPSWDCGFLGIGLVSLGRNFSTGYSNLEGLDKYDRLKNKTKKIWGDLVQIKIRGRL